MTATTLTFRPARTFAEIGGAFEREREELRRLLPAAEVLHTGATSVPDALTRGDLDIHVRVAADAFAEACDALRRSYVAYRPAMWSTGFAAFVAADRRVPTGVALTAIGGEHDRRFLSGWERLGRDRALLEDYNALKVRYEGSGDTDSYETEKSAFFTRAAA